MCTVHINQHTYIYTYKYAIILKIYDKFSTLLTSIMGTIPAMSGLGNASKMLAWCRQQSKDSTKDE
jgi:hypothetical protein